MLREIDRQISKVSTDEHGPRYDPILAAVRESTEQDARSPPVYEALDAMFADLTGKIYRQFLYGLKPQADNVSSDKPSNFDLNQDLSPLLENEAMSDHSQTL